VTRFSIGGELIAIIALTDWTIILIDTSVLATAVVSGARVRLCQQKNPESISEFLQQVSKDISTWRS